MRIGVVRVVLLIAMWISTAVMADCTSLIDTQTTRMTEEISVKSGQILMAVVLCQEKPETALAAFFTRLHPQQHTHNVPTGTLVRYKQEQVNNGSRQITGFIAQVSTDNEYELRLRIRDSNAQFKDIAQGFRLAGERRFDTSVDDWQLTVMRLQ